MFQWGDDRDLPTDFPLEVTQGVITVDDEVLTVEVGDIYDSALALFYVPEPTDPLPPEPTEIELLQGQVTKLQAELNDTKDVIDFLIMS